ncbi:MAG: hypothetical protein ABEK04_03590, partial [Candidatus Nanohalobium sp.]
FQSVIYVFEACKDLTISENRGDRGRSYLIVFRQIEDMDGHKVALGLFLALIASGCAGMTGSASKSPSFQNLTLSLGEVENATGADYTLSENISSNSGFNLSSAVRKVGSFFRQDGNLSSAPETVQSMVMALNGTEKEENGIASKLNKTSIDGYEARQLRSSNKTVLYGQKGNISFFVKAKGNNGIFNSAKSLYKEIAEEVEEFNQS